jgi:uncharacterized membrane protein YbhN (UPF0104 family)
VQVLEKVFEVVTMVVLVAPLPWMLSQLPRSVGSAILAVAVAGLGAGLGITWFAMRSGDERSQGGGLRGLLGRIRAGLAVLRSPSRVLVSLVLSLAAHLADVLVILLTLGAVGLEPSFWWAICALFFVNAAIAVPSTPAQLGAFEAGGVAALVLLGAPKEPALAFALLYHVAQAIPVTLYGGLVLARTGVLREAAAK